MPSYCFGSYGVIRGYGELCRTYREADASVIADGKTQRQNGGTTDRNPVVVTADGRCWWLDAEVDSGTEAAIDSREIGEDDLVPAKTPSGQQARYPWATVGDVLGTGRR
jgi:hypothetical protein